MQIILKILSILAKVCVKKHSPFVIWITWSVGKTSAVNFVYQFLEQKYGRKVFVSPYNYNGEFWLPLTILQQKTGWRNPFLWLFIFVNSLFVILFKKYPKILVLEYGIDHIWEMDYMMNIVEPDISVILNVTENHIMQMKSIENIRKEKLKIIWKKSRVIFNNDDENLKYLDWTSYWINDSSKLKAKNIRSGVWSIIFDLIYSWKEYRWLKYNLVWEFQVYNILALIWVGLEMWIDIEEIIKLSKDIFAPTWRWTILQWINDSIIIDWSYNWGYKSISEWIKYLNDINSEYIKIAFVWDMRELWDKTQIFHEKISEELINSNIDFIILVWEEFNKYSLKQLENKFWKNRVYHFFDSRLAGKTIKNIINHQDKKSLIFVKWSQNTIFLEEGIKEFCLEKEMTKLVRQGKKWGKIKNNFFSKC